MSPKSIEAKEFVTKKKNVRLRRIYNILAQLRIEGGITEKQRRIIKAVGNFKSMEEFDTWMQETNLKLNPIYEGIPGTEIHKIKEKHNA